MIEEVKTRLKELHDRRVDVLEKIAGVFESDEYIQGDSADRARLEDLAGMQYLKKSLWEIKRRESVLIAPSMIPDLDSKNRESLIGYFEKIDGDTAASLEKGLPDNPARKEIAEFVARGFVCDECQSMIDTLNFYDPERNTSG